MSAIGVDRPLKSLSSTTIVRQEQLVEPRNFTAEKQSPIFDRHNRSKNRAVKALQFQNIEIEVRLIF